MIATQRTFKIRKNSFAEFQRVSSRDIWPYFEKIGARILGLWLVTDDEREPATPDYDVVVLVTRYASREHWLATRTPVESDPLWPACRGGLARRRELTIDTWVRFLKPADERIGGPYHHSGKA